MTDLPPEPDPAPPVPDPCPVCAVPTVGADPGDPAADVPASRQPCGHPIVWDPAEFPGVVPTPDVPPPAGAG